MKYFASVRRCVGDEKTYEGWVSVGKKTCETRLKDSHQTDATFELVLESLHDWVKSMFPKAKRTSMFTGKTE